MSTPTPRTDFEIRRQAEINDPSIRNYAKAWPDLCRELERELTAAIAERDRAIAGRSDANKSTRLLGEELQRLMEERRKLQLEIGELTLQRDHIWMHTCVHHTDVERVAVRCPVCAERERDDARKALADLKLKWESDEPGKPGHMFRGLCDVVARVTNSGASSKPPSCHVRGVDSHNRRIFERPCAGRCFPCVPQRCG